MGFAKLAGELALNETTLPVLELVRQDQSGGQVVQGRKQRAGKGDHPRPVRVLGLGPVKAQRQLGPARQHDVMRPGMVVGVVRKRAHQGVLVGEARQFWEMLADLNPVCAAGDRRKLPSKLQRCVGFHVEAFVLGESAGEKDVNHRPCFGGGQPRALPCAGGAWKCSVPAKSAQGRKVVCAQSEQTNGARLKGRAPGQTVGGMRLH